MHPGDSRPSPETELVVGAYPETQESVQAVHASVRQEAARDIWREGALRPAGLRPGNSREEAGRF